MPAFSLLLAPPSVTLGLLCQENAPLPLPSLQRKSLASATGLSPVYCRCNTTRPVSYYALFQGWLLLSQPPGCLGNPTSFSTEHTLRGLSWRSGLFPSRRRSLSPAVSLPHSHTPVFGVWLTSVTR